MLYCNKLSFVFIFKILLAVNFARINDKRGKHNTKFINYYAQQKITNLCYALRVTKQIGIFY